MNCLENDENIPNASSLENVEFKLANILSFTKLFHLIWLGGGWIAILVLEIIFAPYFLLSLFVSGVTILSYFAEKKI